MTGPLPPGLGGLPRVRPDQQFTPPPNVTSPGAAAGVVRARQVIITGGANAGIFVYSPSPGLGTLIGSWTAAAGVDAFGNPYPAGLNVSVGQVTGVLLTATSLTVSEGPILFYGNSSAVNVPFAPGTSGNWTVPAGITAATGAFLAGSGTATASTSSKPGCGGGGGEAVVLALTGLVPGALIPYSVGAAGQPTTFDGVSAAAGGNAVGTTSGGPGGTSSGAGTRFAGGGGAVGSPIGFGGGGGSGGGFTQAGTPGAAPTGGAAPPSGGGAGGDGGGSVTANGQPGAAPGGAPGGGLQGTGHSPGAASGGSLVVSYASSSATQLLMAISSSAGTDNFGNSWNAGFTLFGNAVFKSGLQIPTGAAAKAILTSDASGNAAWNTAIPIAAISNTFSNANWTLLINELIAAGIIV